MMETMGPVVFRCQGSWWNVNGVALIGVSHCCAKYRWGWLKSQFSTSISLSIDNLPKVSQFPFCVLFVCRQGAMPDGRVFIVLVTSLQCGADIGGTGSVVAFRKSLWCRRHDYTRAEIAQSEISAGISEILQDRDIVTIEG